MTTTHRITCTEDAVPVIAAYAAKVIASAGHPGHDLEAVGAVMTSDAVLDKIRTAYNRHTRRGLTPKEAVIETGRTVVAAYCNRAGIAAEGEAVTADPNGVKHRTAGTCAATWKREPVNRSRPELGETTQYGYAACGEPGTVDRFVKAAQQDYYRPVYACPVHAHA